MKNETLFEYSTNLKMENGGLTTSTKQKRERERTGIEQQQWSKAIKMVCREAVCDLLLPTPSSHNQPPPKKFIFLSKAKAFCNL